MKFRRGFVITGGFALVIVGASLIDRASSAQNTDRNAARPTEGEARPFPGELQRSSQIYTFKQSAESGPQRGEEIYYYKCWFCHNKYAKTGPWLGDLYKRGRLVTGQQVTDMAVTEKIRSGSANMPAYRYSLNDRDIADLISYIREGRCCFDEENPPANPRYRAR